MGENKENEAFRGVFFCWKKHTQKLQVKRLVLVLVF